MKAIGIPVALIILVVILIISANLCLYIVNETQQVVVTQFGRPVRVISGSLSNEDATQLAEELKNKSWVKRNKGAGLYIKIPFIQTVHYFEDRVLEYDTEPKDIVTLDKKHLFVDNYARWRIINPLRFLEAVRNEREANSRLDDIVYSILRQELGRNNLTEIIRSTGPGKNHANSNC
jgi:membrane protease subunit HflC